LSHLSGTPIASGFVMSIEDLTLLTQPISLKLPPDWIGWVGLFAFLASILVLLWQWRGFNKPWQNSSWGILFILALLTPITSLFLSFRLPGGNALPPPGTYIDPGGPAVILLAALPWLAAAGLLGPLPASILAALSGILLALWETHNPFTPFELALLAAIVGAALQQRYRTFAYRLLRRPLLIAILVTLIYPLVFIFSSVFSVSGSLAIRLDYALTHVLLNTAAIGIGLLTAGLFGEGIALSLANLWASQTPLQPSPVESHLHTRFLANLAPLGIILVVTLIVGDWIVAGNAARQILNDLMANNSQSAAQTIPFFVETGQNLIQQMALEQTLADRSPAALTNGLQQQLRRVPFFTQLFYFDENGNPLAGYPESDYKASHPSTEEMLGVELALGGVSAQIYTIPPSELQKQARISFMAQVADQTGKPHGVLIGRTELASNPFTQPVLASLKQLEKIGGNGMLVDEKGQVIYYSSEAQALATYSGPTPAEATFFDGTAPNGTRALMYYQPVVGYPWAVVMTMPASIAQQIALGISAPLVVTILILFAIAAVLLRLGLRWVTASLENLATESDRIAGGELTSPLNTQGADEVGQLRRSFEQMRLSLKARLDELNRLLAATQGVASSLEAEQSIRPVLQAALATGANTARVVLEPSSQHDGNQANVESIGLGSGGENYQHLDEQILSLTRKQERLMLANASRARTLQFPASIHPPEALLALALRHKGVHYGALYLLFEQPHQFSNDEQRFLITLANQAALAAANARLFLGSEIERQRLEAILASTPDPVLVTDQQNRLLLANPAAWQAVASAAETGIGQPIEQITNIPPLVNLLRYSAGKQQSSEVTMPDKRIYLATASTVVVEGRPVGRVCVMRDITHFKEVDALKSEFVATVSHDLRSPLTLMRGYATMMEMVGNLNEQQTSYVRKIITSVETMSRLVNNLLDLGRIEAGIDLQLEIIPVSDIAERVIGALQLQANQKHIQLSYEMPPQTTPLVEADQALLQQALYNLVENGVKYTETDGKVNLHIFVEGERMTFEVKDTGIGIAPVDIPRLFEKFYRGAQRESRKQTGSGLGLAIVKSIAERHGGGVHVDSQLGKGSTFSLTIPVRQPKRESRPKRETLPKRPSETRPPGF
jgi:signal transduction histidine kinase/HAMP domain-containing protein